MSVLWQCTPKFSDVLLYLIGENGGDLISDVCDFLACDGPQAVWAEVRLAARKVALGVPHKWEPPVLDDGEDALLPFGELGLFDGLA